LGVRLTTSPCKKKFVENLLRKKILEEAKAHIWAVVPLMMMMMTDFMSLPRNTVYHGVKINYTNKRIYSLTKYSIGMRS
jgi:hypothetical protein